MKRSVIIAKCIGLIETGEKILVTFDKPINSLCFKYVLISNKDCKQLGTLLPNGIIELYNAHVIKINDYYQITIYNIWIPGDREWMILKQSRDDYIEETALLWQEFGSLIDPTIEAIDLYINELNKRT